MNSGKIYAIAISPERGQQKKEVEEAEVLAGHGIVNDGHAGDWGRQITILMWESVIKANRENELEAGPGDFAENILTEGLDLSLIQPGALIRMGSRVIVEVSQVGKEDHPSVVTRTLGVTLLPYEGLFCRVIEGGTIRRGDPVMIIENVD